MSKVKTKLVSLLVALSCVFACLGVGVFASKAINAKASDYTTYTITAVGATADSDATVINVTSVGGEELPVVEEEDWDNDYSFEEGSGTGLTLNGVSVAMDSAYLPTNYFCIILNGEAKDGDVFTIDGAFYNDTTAVKVVFVNCSLVFNGSVWTGFTSSDLTSYNVGELTLHVNSQPYGGAGTVNNNLYLQRADGEDYEQYGWESLFVGKADGFKVNGVPATLNKMVSTDAGIFFDFAAANAGDVITISGSFVNESEGVEFVIAESSFMWTVNGWVKTVALTTYEVGKVVIGNGSGAGAVYFAIESGAKFEKVDGTWAEKLTYAAGTGVTINGTQINMGDIKIPNDMYVGLGLTAQEGDVMVVGGTFYNNNLAVKYVITESVFSWNGSAWVQYVETPGEPDTPVEYEVFTATNVGATGSSNASTLYLYDADGNLPKERVTDDWGNVYAFEGTITLGGETVAVSEAKFPGDLYLVIGTTASVGDVLAINGAFTNDTTAFKLVFDCKLEWNGSAWVQYVEPIEYTVYNVSAIRSENTSDATTLYITPADGDGGSFGVGDWANVYTLEAGTGTGLTLGTTTLTTTDIKQPGAFFIVLGATAVEGDIFTIDGAYYNETTAKKIVFENCKLVFNGSAWETYEEPIEYTVHQIGALILHGNSNVGGASGDNGVLYLMRKDGGELPVKDWSKIFVAENAENFKVNGETATLIECKSTGDGFFWKFNALNADDVLTISGTFTCEDLAVKYVIEESHFQWTGERWYVYVPSTAYTQVQLGKVTGIVDGNYLTFADGITLPVSDWGYAFNDITGNGITINGVSVSLVNNIKSVGNKLHVAFGVGDVDSILLIEGSFRNVDTLYEYVIERSEFRWTGSAWVSTAVIEYTTHDIGAVTVHAHSGKGAASTAPTALYMARVDGEVLPILLWENPFILESGDGLKVNGNPVNLLEMQSTDAGLYIRLDGIVAGDVVSLSGTFACPTQGVKYVIAESKMVWNGSYWEVYAEYTDYEIGEMRIISASSSADTVYMYRADGLALPLRDTDWVNLFDFRAGSGVGLTLNDEALPFGHIKSPNDFYVVLGAAAVEGDVLKIGGTFYSATAAVAYIITESEFVYTDAGWRNKIDIVKEGLYADLDAYYAELSVDNYYEAEATLLVTTYEEGKAGIASAITIADAEQALVDAKAALDAIDTKEESDAKLPEKKESAKAELLAYKAQADYHDAQWAEIQAVIAQANVAIDACTSTSEVIKAVADAKVLMDAVYTAEIYDAHKVVADDAKAELVAYKAQADYHDAEWTAIQAIIAQANADIDKAFGDADAIAQVVVDAKAEIDLVETAVVVDARNLATAKENATNEVQAYYGAIDYTLYTDEAFGQIGALVDPALEAIANATSIEDVNAIVTAFKADVDAVEKIPAEKPASGCMSSIGGGLVAGLMPLMAIALARVLKKKEY